MHLLSVHDDSLLAVLGYCRAQDIYRVGCSCKRLLKLSMNVEALHCAGGISGRALDFFYKLKHLSMANAVRLTEDRLLKIVCKCPSLLSLQIQRLNLVQDDGTMVPDSREHEDSSGGNEASALLTPEYDNSFFRQSQTLSMSSLVISRLYLEGHAFVSYFSDTFLRLQELTLDACATIGDEDMVMILALCSHLHTLYARKMFSITSLASVHSISPLLTTLSFQKCSQLQVFTVGEGCSLQQLVDLDLSYTNITSASLVSLLRSCPSITTLDIKQCMAIREDLSISSQRIQSIDAAMCVNVKKMSIECPTLTKLNILHCHELSSLSVLSNKLTRLDLSMLKMLQSVKLKCPSLASCLIAGCAAAVVSNLLEENPSLQLRPNGGAVCSVGSPGAGAVSAFLGGNSEQVFEAERAVRARLRDRRSSTIG